MMELNIHMNAVKRAAANDVYDQLDLWPQATNGMK